MDLAEALSTPREGMDFDVVIVGAGPAGLAAAIRLKQIDADLSVVVVEKGSEVGAHILSGAVVDPIGLDKLLPDWRQDPDAPLRTPVTDDRFYVLGPAGFVRLPNMLMPKLMSNHGNYIVSLGNVARWMATRAEALGVEIYPGFAAAEVLYGEAGEVVGVATGDMGISKSGEVKDSFTRGMELRGKYVLFAEGARGSLSKQVIRKFELDAGPRAPEIRHRPEGALAGRAGEASSRAGAALVRLAARQFHWRRVVPVPSGRQSGRGRLRRSPQLFEPDALALRRIPALQDPSAGARHVPRRQAHLAMAPAPSRKADGSPCPSYPSPAARSSDARRVSSTSPASRARTTRFCRGSWRPNTLARPSRRAGPMTN